MPVTVDDDVRCTGAKGGKDNNHRLVIQSVCQLRNENQYFTRSKLLGLYYITNTVKLAINTIKVTNAFNIVNCRLNMTVLIKTECSNYALLVTHQPTIFVVWVENIFYFNLFITGIYLNHAHIVFCNSHNIGNIRICRVFLKF